MTSASETSEFYYIEEYIWAMLDGSTQFGISSRHAFGSTWTIPKERLFDSILEVQIYVDRVQASVNELWPRHKKRLIVEAHLSGKESDGIYAGIAHHQNGKIRIPPHGHGRSRFMREMLVLHEIAHYYSSTHTHGDKFRSTLLKLIETQMDPMFAQFFGICIASGIDNIK